MRRIVLLVVVVLFALATSVVWVVQTRDILDRVSASASDAFVSIFANLEYQPEPELCRYAQDLTVDWGDAETAAKEDCAKMAKILYVDRVSVVGTNGIVLASSEPSFVGFDFASNSNTVEFLELNTGTHFLTQPFRKPVDDPNAPLMKFVGIAFPNGGFVQIGDSIHPGDAKRRDYVFAQSMENEQTSYDGYYAVVDEKNDLVVSSFLREHRGVRASEFGFSSLDFGSGDGPIVGTVFGRKSMIWRAKPDFFDVTAYVIFPLDSIMHPRNVTVGVMALVLFALLSVGYLFFLKVYSQSVRLREQSRKMEEFYAKEEADRQRDMALAKSIQASALPSVFPPYPGRKEFDLYATMRTAREVGGDFYDFYFVGPNRICLIVADVSGKGIPAALFMMRSRTVLKSSVTTTLDLAAAVSLANNQLCANNTAEMFVTAWVGILDLETGELRYVSAGHNPPFLRRADGTVAMLKVKPALVLAAMEGVKYREDTVQLRAGDRIFLYTDGVTEATAAGGELFGDARLEATMRTVSGDAAACCGQTLAAVDAFVGAAPQADDITMLVFDYKGAGGRT